MGVRWQERSGEVFCVPPSAVGPHTPQVWCAAPAARGPAPRRAQRRESQPARSTGGPTAARESAAVRPATCGRHTEWAFGGRSVPGKFSASLHPQSGHTRLMCGAPHPPPAGRRRDAPSVANRSRHAQRAALRPRVRARPYDQPRAADTLNGRSVAGAFRGSFLRRQVCSVPAATRRASARRRRHAGGTANIAGDGFATLAARGRARAHLLALLRPLRALAGPAAPGRRDRVG